MKEEIFLKKIQGFSKHSKKLLLAAALAGLALPLLFLASRNFQKHLAGAGGRTFLKKSHYQEMEEKKNEFQEQLKALENLETSITSSSPSAVE